MSKQLDTCVYDTYCFARMKPKPARDSRATLAGEAIVALVAGPIALINGGLNLALANGGPGTGNGVVGGAAAFVLGLIAVAVGGVAVARSRHTALEPGRIT